MRTELNGLTRPGAGGIDLHTHSFYSDGTQRPAEIVREANRAGLGVISLTDHDTIRGLQEAKEECRSLGLAFIPGVELSVGLGSEEIHILGYGVDPKSKALQNSLYLLAAEREERMEKMAAALRRLGMPVEFEEIKNLACGVILSRLHLAAYLMQKGIVKDQEEAFKRYIGAGRPAYIGRNLLTLKEAIGLIVEAGGMAVLAHPGLTRRDDIIEYLIRIGINGIEVFYPKHTPGDISKYMKICRKFDIVATGGSDFHGLAKPEVSIGCSLTPLIEFEKMKKIIKLH